jgi:5'-3' exonuclease
MYHGSEGEEQSSARRKTLGFVRDKIVGFDSVKVALDCPPYNRKSMYPEYKANRKERPIALIEELKKTVESVLSDGWAVLRSDGAEADDIIATYCLENKDDEIVIFGTDKDLLQINEHCPSVILRDVFAGVDKSAEDTLGVEPNKVVDFLALCGDKADNIPGLSKVGPVTALKLLKEFGSVEGVIKAMDNPENFKPSFYDKLVAEKDQLIMSYKLVELDYNCEITEEQREIDRNIKEDEPMTEQTTAIEATVETDETFGDTKPQEAQIITRHEALSYKQSLEPIGFNELRSLANVLKDSGHYNGFMNAQGIAAAIMAGRELGLGAVASLSSIHIIKGKPTMAPQGMLALIMGSGKAEYFDCVETTVHKAVFVTKRVGSKNETRLEFTIQQAQQMALTGKDNWKKQPDVMLRWRCVAALARLVYPDVVLGVYSEDEMEQ